MELLFRTRKNAHHRSGVVVIMLVLVLCSMAIALLVLAGQTCIQLKSARSASLNHMQCNELIALGEKVLMERLVANPDFTNEVIRFDLPYSVQAISSQHTQVGVIELTKIGNTESTTVQRWSIDVTFGLKESASVKGSKRVDLEMKTK